MNRVEKLQEETGSVASLWVQYKQIKQFAKKNKKAYDLFCFYEGKDDCKFYNVKLKELGKKITHFVCYSKSNVLKFRKYMKKNHKEMNDVAYYVDKDFDDKINYNQYVELTKAKDLYITPCYSIENFYTTGEVFDQILLNEYGYTICDPTYIKLKDKFITLKKGFHEYIKKINYWYATYKYFYIINQIEFEIKLSDFNLGRYIDIDLKNNKIIIKSIEKISLLDSLEEKLKPMPNTFPSKMKEITRLFIDDDLEFRGKMELFFLSKLIDKINKDKGYKDFSVSNNIISNIVQYTDLPKCLRDFIKSL